MAKNSGSFLYQIQLDLDAGKAAADYGSFITDVRSQMDGLRTSVQNAMTGLGKMASPEFTRLERHIQRTDDNLQKMVSRGAKLTSVPENASQAFSGLNKKLLGLDERIQQADASLAGMVQRGARLQEIPRGMSSGFEVLTNQADDVGDALVKMSRNIKDSEDAVEDFANSFGLVEDRFADIRSEIAQTDASLETMASGGSLQQLSSEVSEAAAAQDNLQAEIVQSSNAQEELNDTMSAGSSQFNKTSQTSQNLLRIMQDAQFGMLGMANNFQALSEDLGRAGSRGTTAMKQLKQGVKSLVMGPFAIPAAVTAATLLIQVDWSSVPKKIDKWTAALKRFIFGLSDAEKELKNLSDAFEDFRDVDEEDAMTEFTRKLAKIGGEDGDAQMAADLVQQFGENANQSAQRLTGLTDALDEIATQDLQEQFTDMGAKTLRQKAATVSDEFKRALQEGDFGMLKDLQESLPYNEVSALVLAMRDAKAEIKKSGEAMAALNNESLKQQEKIDIITEKTGMSRDLVRNVLEFEKQTTNEKEKQVKFELERLDALSKIRDEIMMAAAEDVGPLTAARTEVAQEFASRKEDIENQYAEQREKVKSELEKGSKERQKKLKEIAQRERRTLQALAMRREQAMGDAVDEARAEMAKENVIEPEEMDFMEDPILVNGQFVESQKFIEQQTQEYELAQERIQARLEEVKFNIQQGGQGFSPFGGDSALGDMANVKRMRALMKKRTKLQVEQLNERKEIIDAKVKAEKIGEEKALEMKKKIEAEKTRIQENAARKRVQIAVESMNKIANSIETSPVGGAVLNLITDIGGLWQGFHENQFKWQQKSMRERAQLVGQLGGQIAGRMANIAEKSFASWKSQRKQDLKDQGKTAEERRKILKREGKKRFMMMKAMKITEASINTATGVTRALAELPPPASYAAAAATAAAGLFRIKQIASMSIGDKIGGGGGGSGQSGGKFTQRGAANAATAAGRVGTGIKQERNNNEDVINKTAERVGSEVARQQPDRVVLEDSTAEAASDRAKTRRTKLNK